MSSADVENDPNQLKICPYDPVHRVSAKRFPYHLAKCRKVSLRDAIFYMLCKNFFSNLSFIQYVNEMWTVWLRAQNVVMFSSACSYWTTPKLCWKKSHDSDQTEVNLLAVCFLSKRFLSPLPWLQCVLGFDECWPFIMKYLKLKRWSCVFKWHILPKQIMHLSSAIPLGGGGVGAGSGFPSPWRGHRAIKVKKPPLLDGDHIEEHQTIVNLRVQTE